MRLVTPGRTYNISPDGQRFLMIKEIIVLRRRILDFARGGERRIRVSGSPVALGDGGWMIEPDESREADFGNVRGSAHQPE